jgi:hypothetical protein
LEILKKKFSQLITQLITKRMQKETRNANAGLVILVIITLGLERNFIAE